MKRSASPSGLTSNEPTDPWVMIRTQELTWMADSQNLAMPVYSPSNEPYLGRQSVFHFDQVIQLVCPGF